MNVIKGFVLVPLFCLALTSCGGGGGSPNLAPVISGSQSIDVLEGVQLSEAYSFSDPENGSIYTSLSGDDAGLMALSSDGNLTFTQVPDFEAAEDLDANNVYDVNVVASDGVDKTLYAVSITVSNAIEGRVVDGPVSGSVVFVDINNDGVQGSDEPTGTTNADGYFAFAEITAVTAGTVVIATGGTDTQTDVELDGLTLISEISTSADVVAVTPITTVLVGLPNDAQKIEFLSAVALADASASLLTSDDWAAAQSGDTAAQASQRASQQIAVVLQGLHSLTADNAAKTAIEQTQVVAAKIAKVSQEQINFSLSSTESIVAIIEESLDITAPGVYTDTVLLNAVAQSVAAINTVVSDVTIDPTSELAGEVALAVQVDMQASLDSLASGDTDTATYAAATVLGTLLANVTIPADAADQDGDGIADILDDDNDGDGVIDIEDVFPNDGTETTDHDGDGVGNNMDEDVLPVITLNGAATVNHEQGTTYTDAGAIATDTVEGTVTVTVSGAVDSATAGAYTLTYNASDSAGNAAIVVTRTVTVADTVAPVITLSGLASVNHEQGTTYSDAGATASDTVDGSVTVVSSGTVDTAIAGSYTVTYTVSDSIGNTSTVTRTVIVADTLAPVITLLGLASVNHEQGTTYSDAGATASDTVDGSVTVVSSGTVDTAIAGSYTVTYTVSDSIGNTSTVTRTVIVADTLAPVITLLGLASVNHEQGTTYTDLGATASDTVGGTITVTVTGSVVIGTAGTYTLTYTVTDAAGNTATAVTRTVTVADTVAPVITLSGSASLNHEQGTTYTDLGATAIDPSLGSATVVTSGAVNTSVAGTYTLTYTSTDSGGNSAVATRTVTVSDTLPPTISLAGASTVNVAKGATYTDAGSSATDSLDGSVSVTVTGSVNTSATGSYTLTYTATDSAGNTSVTTRAVTVIAPTALSGFALPKAIKVIETE